jgi:anthranilate phosphoribosyltransferase
MIIESLKKVQAGRHLTESEAFETFREVMNGEATSEVTLAALLTAMQMNGPDIAEVTGAARAMRQVCLTVHAPENAVDIVGTGGDGFGTFNVSTTAAIIAAGAGVTIAKHGNKAATSKSGSADCLAALGYDLVTPLEEVERSIRENGIGFLFANRCHPAMMYAAPVRKALPFRTVFNLIGPLSNPAKVQRYALGVYAPEIVPLYIGVLKALGTKKALVFCGPDGLDELGLSGVSHISELGEDGTVREYTFDPKRFFGMTRPLAAISGGTPKMNAAITRKVLSGEERGAYRDAAALNASAAIVAAGMADTLESGIILAYDAIDSGKALAKLAALTGGRGTTRNGN